VTDQARIARVALQLRSLLDLHGRELQTLADQLDAQGATQLAERVRVFRGLHVDEIGAVIQELQDLSGGEPPPVEQHQEEAQPLTRRELLNLAQPDESEPV
jgi:hypothetical protein